MNVTATTSSAQPDASKQRTELNRAAEQLVSEAFLNTLMRMHRENPLKGKYGHGGRGEEIFGGQLDSILAEKASTSMRTTLTEAVIRQLSRERMAGADDTALRATLEVSA